MECKVIYQRRDSAYGSLENTPVLPSFSTSDSTGKELDSETGFSYFGARYLDHTLLTSWFSVDPMSDKYPNISPYAYCAWNPVNLVDPEGKKIKGVSFNEETGSYTFSKRAIRNGTFWFVRELMKTEKGREILDGLMGSSVKFKVRITDKPLFGASRKGGKFVQFDGRYIETTKTIWISTSNKITENEGDKRVKGVYFDPVTDKNEDCTIKCADIELRNYGVPEDYIKAYHDSGMESFEKIPENTYRFPAEKVHGTGVHEGSHALQDSSMKEYNRDFEAFTNERIAREQYKEVCP